MLYSLLNENFEVVDIVEEYDTAIWTERYNVFGDFELHLAASKAAFNKYKDDYYLQSTESDRLMIIEETAVEDDYENGSMLKVSGRSLESLLARRIIWNNTTLTGDFQNAIAVLLRQNVSAPSDPARKLTDMSIKLSTDPSITSLTIDAQYMGDNLYTVISDLCASNDLGFKIILLPNKTFQFSLYRGIDRSTRQTKNDPVVFSPDFDNLSNSKYAKTKKTLRTVSLTHGSGEPDVRTYAVANLASGPGVGLSRRETFTDASSVPTKVDDVDVPPSVYAKQLIQKGIEDLVINQVTTTFDGQIDMLKSLQYKVHFDMGDIIQMQNEYGVGAISRITEFIRSDSPSGREAYPTVQAIEL